MLSAKEKKNLEEGRSEHVLCKRFSFLKLFNIFFSLEFFFSSMFSLLSFTLFSVKLKSFEMWFHGVKSFILITCWWFVLSNFAFEWCIKKGSDSFLEKIHQTTHQKFRMKYLTILWGISREKIYHLHHNCMCSEFVYVFGPINSNKSKKISRVPW